MSGFGAFGGAAPAAASGFGTTTTASPFGAPAAATLSFGTAPKPATTGFGMPAAAPAASAFPSFGSLGQKPAAAPTTTFGGFGSPPPANTAATGLSGFGTFGAAPAAAAAPAATTGFGAFNFNNTAAAQQQQQQQQQPPPPAPIADAIERLKRSYAPARNAQGQLVNVPEGYRNEECAFKYIALNKREGQVQNNQALLYGNLLDQAEKDNADPDQYQPVEEVGIAALKARFERQGVSLQKMQAQSTQLEGVMREISSESTFLSAKVSMLRSRQRELNLRVLHIMRQIEVLRCHGTPMQDGERRYQHYLQSLAQRLEAPLESVQSMALNVALHEDPTANGDDSAASANISEEDLAALVVALKKQSDGLETLTEILRKDLRDVQIVRQATHASGL